MLTKHLRLVHRTDCRDVEVGDQLIRVFAGQPMILSVKSINTETGTFELAVPGQPVEEGWTFDQGGVEIDDECQSGPQYGRTLSYIAFAVENLGAAPSPEDVC